MPPLDQIYWPISLFSKGGGHQQWEVALTIDVLQPARLVDDFFEVAIFKFEEAVWPTG